MTHEDPPVDPDPDPETLAAIVSAVEAYLADETAPRPPGPHRLNAWKTVAGRMLRSETPARLGWRWAR